MELDPKDFDVVELLAKLKTLEPQYPSELFASRRLGYVQRVAEIGVGAGAASRLKKSAKAGNSGGATPTIGGIFEMALVAAILAEAGAAAYIYRDQIAKFIQSQSSNTQVSEIAPPPEEPTRLPEFLNTETPEPALTSTTTTIPTIVPTVVVENNEADVQSLSTPDLKGNNGNHYGQTPKPERTKEKGNKDGEGDQGKGRDK